MANVASSLLSEPRGHDKERKRGEEDKRQSRQSLMVCGPKLPLTLVRETKKPPFLGKHRAKEKPFTPGLCQRRLVSDTGFAELSPGPVPLSR